MKNKARRMTKSFGIEYVKQNSQNKTEINKILSRYFLDGFCTTVYITKL